MSYYETCRMKFWGTIAHGLVLEGFVTTSRYPSRGLFGFTFAYGDMIGGIIDSATMFDRLGRGRAYYLDGGK